MCDSMCLSFSLAKVGNACYTLLSYVLQTCYKVSPHTRHPRTRQPPFLLRSHPRLVMLSKVLCLFT